jgi:hypothetical protein
MKNPIKGLFSAPKADRTMSFEHIRSEYIKNPAERINDLARRLGVSPSSAHRAIGYAAMSPREREAAVFRFLAKEQVRDIAAVMGYSIHAVMECVRTALVAARVECALGVPTAEELHRCIGAPSHGAK